MTREPVPAADARLREWEVAQETTRHFNDLIVRLRATGLPLTVAAAAGAASISGSGNVDVRPPLPLWAAVAFLGLLGVAGVVAALSALVRFGVDRPGEFRPGGRPLAREWITFFFVALTPLVAALAIGCTATDIGAQVRVPLAAMLLLAAVVLITAIYAMDRFYYYLLLVGAVQRLQVLEGELGFDLSKSIQRSTPENLARVVLLSVYMPPIWFGIVVACWLLWQAPVLAK